MTTFWRTMGRTHRIMTALIVLMLLITGGLIFYNCDHYNRCAEACAAAGYRHGYCPADRTVCCCTVQEAVVVPLEEVPHVQPR